MKTKGEARRTPNLQESISGRFFLRTFFWPRGQICFESMALLLHLCFEIGFLSARNAGIRNDSFWLWIVSRGSKRCLLKREYVGLDDAKGALLGPT